MKSKILSSKTLNIKANWEKYLSFFILGILTVYNIIFFSQSYFISDDLILLKAAIYKPFPFFSDWISSNLQFYRPIVILSFYLNYIIVGYNPFGYYIFNLLIHILSCLAIYKLLILFFADIENQKLIKQLSFVFTIIYYALPQNYVNVYWISGRTDLLMSLFLFTSLVFAVRYYIKGKMSDIITYFVLLLMSALSKESWVVVIFYLGVFFVLKFNSNEVKRKEAMILFVSTMFVFLIYLMLRFIIFGNLGGNAKIFFTIERILKFLTYFVFSLFVPIDILEYYYFYKGNYTLFILVTSSIACIIFYFTFLTYKKSFNKRLFIIFFIILGTSLIYIINFPTMRLMYSIIPLTAIPLILMRAEFIPLKKTSLFLLIIPFLTVLSTGIIINIHKYKEIQRYNVNYYDNLPNDNNVFEKIIDLSALLNIGQSYSLPESNIMMDLKLNNAISRNNDNLIIKPFLYQTYTFSNPLKSLRYKTQYDNQITISTNNNHDVIMAVEEADANNRYNESSYKLQNGIELLPQSYSKDRTGYLTSLKIIIPETLINSKTGVIYQDNGELKISNLLYFLKSHE